MLYCLRGELIKKTPEFAVVMCSGIGFQVYISSVTYTELPEEGEQATVYTYMSIQQDSSVNLFGFGDEAQLDCFKLLITVSGIGPKSALGILSFMNSDQVIAAISQGDFHRFTQCPGVGSKTAQRIVLELKDKVKNLGYEAVSTPAAPAQNENAQEAIAALMSLGFTRSEARAAVSKQDPSLDTSELIRKSLQYLSNR
ncbi:MAG: Holliday junction branch migration protein RuvA [Oscillospiraceae bacterium]|nr:Holliday junction branch migration protein RuvA [Oscillospiraceae bacterium]